MRADVTDRIWRERGILQCQLHRCRHRFAGGLGDVIAIGIAAESNNFRIDARPARTRMFVFLQHQRGGTFAHHQAIAVAVEGTGREVWFVVARAGGEQGIEHRHARAGKFFGTAAQHQLLLALLDGLVAKADRLTAGRARAGRRHNASLQSEEHANVHSGGMRHHLHVAGGRDTLHGAGFQHAPHYSHGFDAAARRAICHAHATVADRGIAVQTCIAQCAFAGGNRKLRDAAHRTQMLTRPVG